MSVVRGSFSDSRIRTRNIEFKLCHSGLQQEIDMHITIHALMIVALMSLIALPMQAGSLDQDSQSAVEARGSVTGRVTVDGKPAQGIVITLNKQGADRDKVFELALKGSAGPKTVTDEEGIFRFNDVPTGRYEVSPFAPALVISSESKSSGDEQTITVSEGKTTEGVNFALSRGGVITGRVTDAEGRPVIRETISLNGADDNESARAWQPKNSDMLMTDDRGIYRIYGLPPGRYIVSAGGNARGVFRALTGGRNTTHTYHPGVIDRAKAKVVEVTAGGEAGSIDIKLSPAAKGPYASGRVIDEAGNPVPNVMVTAMPGSGEGAGMLYSGGFTASSAKGEFRFDNLHPGKYRAIAQIVGQDSDFYAEPLPFEVKNEDVKGLEIRLQRGSSISGIVVIEGANDPEMMSELSKAMLTASVTDSESGVSASDADGVGEAPSAFGFARGTIFPNGSFRIAGLRPGKVTISTFNVFGSSELQMVRTEREGAEISSIDIKAGESITGVKLVFAIARGIIRGKVVNLNGKLPADAEIEVHIYRSGTSESVLPFWGDDIDVDEQGNFVIKNLTAGSYDIEVTVEYENATAGEPSKTGSAKQTVIVTNDAPTEVTITVDIKKDR